MSACQRPASEQPSPSPPQAVAKVAPEPGTPSSAPAQLTTLDQVKPQKPDPESKRRYVVAALGDSITDARSGGGGYLKVLREHCPSSEFLNYGKGGDMTNQMRRRWESDIRPNIEALGLNTLIVYGGVNDLYSDLTAGRTNDRIEEDLAGIYQSAKAAGLEVIAVTVSPWGGFSRYWNPRRGENTRLLNGWIMGQVATGLVDHAVDSFTPLSCGDSDVLCVEYQTMVPDGLHPGPAGHAIVGQKLAEEVLSDCR